MKEKDEWCNLRIEIERDIIETYFKNSDRILETGFCSGSFFRGMWGKNLC
jgi:hypothetical protein